MAIMVTMIMVCWDVVTSQITWCHIQEDLIFRVTPTNALNQVLTTTTTTTNTITAAATTTTLLLHFEEV
jgi:hypothetical protein